MLYRQLSTKIKELSNIQEDKTTRNSKIIKNGRNNDPNLQDVHNAHNFD